MTPKPSAPNNVERHNKRWEVSLSLVLIALSLTIGVVMMTVIIPATTTQSAYSIPFPAQLRNVVYRLSIENLMQSLWPEPIAPDPALPSIMNYIRVHEALQPAFSPTALEIPEDARAFDLARLNSARPSDPNAWSVYAYLRAHGQLP